jgi:hypothetical protein
VDYATLGRIIDKYRPYGDEVTMPDLGNPNSYVLGVAPRRVNSKADPKIDVFGALRDFNEADGRLQVRVTEDPYTRKAVVVPAIPDVVEDGIFHVTLPSGIEYRITKGLLVPYTYKAKGDIPVHASILILYNGSGNP